MEEQKAATETVKYEHLVVYEGARFKTLLTRKHRERKAWTPYDPCVVCAFIPGTIRKIFVKEGQSVKKGEKLLILEAMKMLNELAAPISGTVKAIHAKTGVTVPKSQVLVELEPAPVPTRRKKAKK